MSESFRDRVDASDLKKNAQREAEARAIIEFFIANPLPSDTLKMERDMLYRARKWLKGKHD